MGSDNLYIFQFAHGVEEVPLRIVFKKCYRPLVHYANQKLKDVAEAEDIVVNAFEKLLRKPVVFESMQHLEGYLYTIVRHACIDILRKRSRNAVWITELEYIRKGEKEEISDELMKTKILQELNKEIEALPAQCKRIFKLIFIDGLNSKEVATNIGISTKTVLNQKARALRILRNTLLKKQLLHLIMYGWTLLLGLQWSQV